MNSAGSRSRRVARTCPSLMNVTPRSSSAHEPQTRQNRRLTLEERARDRRDDRRAARQRDDPADQRPHRREAQAEQAAQTVRAYKHGQDNADDDERAVRRSSGPDKSSRPRGGRPVQRDRAEMDDRSAGRGPAAVRPTAAEAAVVTLPEAALRDSGCARVIRPNASSGALATGIGESAQRWPRGAIHDLAPGGAGAVENRAGYRNWPIPSSGWPGSRGEKRRSSLLTLKRGPSRTRPPRISV